MGEASLLFGKAAATFLVLECCANRPFLCAWDRGHCRISPRLLASYSKVPPRSAGTCPRRFASGSRGHALVGAVPSCPKVTRPLGWCCPCRHFLRLYAGRIGTTIISTTTSSSRSLASLSGKATSICGSAWCSGAPTTCARTVRPHPLGSDQRRSNSLRRFRETSLVPVPPRTNVAGAVLCCRFLVVRADKLGI